MTLLHSSIHAYLSIIHLAEKNQSLVSEDELKSAGREGFRIIEQAGMVN